MRPSKASETVPTAENPDTGHHARSAAPSAGPAASARSALRVGPAPVRLPLFDLGPCCMLSPARATGCKSRERDQRIRSGFSAARNRPECYSDAQPLQSVWRISAINRSCSSLSRPAFRLVRALQSHGPIMMRSPSISTHSRAPGGRFQRSRKSRRICAVCSKERRVRFVVGGLICLVGSRRAAVGVKCRPARRSRCSGASCFQVENWRCSQLSHLHLVDDRAAVQRGGAVAGLDMASKEVVFAVPVGAVGKGPVGGRGRRAGPGGRGEGGRCGRGLVG